VWEGFGLPILEAMAQGVPVVTSKGTSTEEVAGGAAQLVDPLDIESIANGVVMALANREELGDLGRNRAKAMSWEATALATAQVYDEVIAHS
jgi:glycosyltransferase involved in cell wall biosynthesis